MRKLVGIDILALTALTCASLFFTVTLINFAREFKELSDLEAYKPASRSPKPLESYSWIGRDHPKRLPIEERPVKMIAQESVHFPLTGAEAKDEWLWTATMGDGHVRIGKDMRMFAVSMFHQLHCLRGVQNALAKGWKTLHPARRGHINHCFNYIRQWTLCNADLTLEPGDFAKRNFTEQRAGATHTCVDWVPAYDFMNEKWREWTIFRAEHNITVHDEMF
ncbi:hypothetical protein FA15DRAFT_683358 [Coprinopsis marcescibilis]|uniref:Oxidase ustYa n=1 Tax=Coprinopsis marcescibilis TaxID=230819 RepID=A0A5C3KER1_COPMA|nr:hypothetical protein FA15DRAFT_683358 [Coprinopsis marcescibilis]